MKTVLITGASRNIGAHLALRFGERGYNVVMCARDEARLNSAADLVRDAGANVLAAPADVARAADVQELVSGALAKFGTIDILINNAVIRVQRDLLEMTEDEWDLTLGVALGGAFNCTRAVAPGMIANRWGRIINFTGISGQQGSRRRAGLVTAKAGLVGFTKAMARELGEHGITVNAVSPGSIGTDRGEWTAIGDAEAVREHYDRDISAIPLKRMGSLDEIVDPCLFLASQAASFITGQTLSVNGGRLMP